MNFFKWVITVFVLAPFVLDSGYAEAAGSKMVWGSDVKRNNRMSGSNDSTRQDEMNSVRWDYVNFDDPGTGTISSTRSVNRYRYIRAGGTIVQGDLLTLDTATIVDSGALVMRPLSAVRDTGARNTPIWAVGIDLIDTDNYGWVLENGWCTGVMFEGTIAAGEQVVSSRSANRIESFRSAFGAGDTGVLPQPIFALERKTTGQRGRIWINR